MGAYPSKHTHGCIRLRLTNWQTDRQSFSKSREWVFLHLFMFIGIRSIGRRLRHYLYKLVHYTQLDSNITYTVFIKKYGIKITSFESPSFPICVKTNAGTRARTAHSTYRGNENTMRGAAKISSNPPCSLNTDESEIQEVNPQKL